MDIVTAVWLSLVVGAFVAGFFVGKRHGVRAERGAKALKETVGKL